MAFPWITMLAGSLAAKMASHDSREDLRTQIMRNAAGKLGADTSMVDAKLGQKQIHDAEKQKIAALGASSVQQSYATPDAPEKAADGAAGDAAAEPPPAAKPFTVQNSGGADGPSGYRPEGGAFGVDEKDKDEWLKTLLPGMNGGGNRGGFGGY
jgi:hypothetical protein